MNEPGLIREMIGEMIGETLGAATLEKPRTIAVVGLSADPSKPSNYVPAYMQQHGYKIYPVNPTVSKVLGETSYASLSDLPVKPDIVNVFRLPAFIPAMDDAMLQIVLQNLLV